MVIPGPTRVLNPNTISIGSAVFGHTMRKQGNCLEKEIMQGTIPGARRRGRPRTAWIDNIKSWTGFAVEESIRMTEDRDKWRKYVHGVANPRIEDGKGTEQTYFTKLIFRNAVKYLWITTLRNRLPWLYKTPPSSLVLNLQFLLAALVIYINRRVPNPCYTERRENVPQQKSVKALMWSIHRLQVTVQVHRFQVWVQLKISVHNPYINEWSAR